MEQSTPSPRSPASYENEAALVSSHATRHEEYAAGHLTIANESREKARVLNAEAQELRRLEAEASGVSVTFGEFNNDELRSLLAQSRAFNDRRDATNKLLIIIMTVSLVMQIAILIHKLGWL